MAIPLGTMPMTDGVEKVVDQAWNLNSPAVLSIPHLVQRRKLHVSPISDIDCSSTTLVPKGRYNRRIAPSSEALGMIPAQERLSSRFSASICAVVI
jgi:hypothetical protein